MSKFHLNVDVENDLNDIWEYIAADDLNAADAWITRIFDAFESLSQSPGMGHTREDLTSLPILFWPVGAYLVLYRRRGEAIDIVAVTQGSRDIPTFLRRNSL